MGVTEKALAVPVVLRFFAMLRGAPCLAAMLVFLKNATSFLYSRANHKYDHQRTKKTTNVQKVP